MAKHELEPCPCCGGEARLKDVQGAKIRQGWVGCPACHLYINWKVSPGGAIRKWNKRVAAPDSMIVSLTPLAVSLLKLMPEAVNDLADRLSQKIGELILFGGEDNNG